MRTVFSLFVFLLITLSVNAQENYQSDVEYAIEVKLDDVNHFLHAQLRMQFRNSSPASLDTVWFHLWPNGYRDRFTSLCAQKLSGNDFGLYFAKQKDKGYVDSLDFTVDGEKATWGYHPKHSDIAWILPKAPLKKGQVIKITTPFRVKIPSGRFSRLGHIGKSYQITQWYPKLAVFDDEGWHTMPYLNQGEFFSPFATFNVSLTLPSNYVVGATGEIQTSSELEFLNQLSEKAIPENASNDFPESSKTEKTIRYSQTQVHDFAWFADMRYIVRKGSVTLPGNGETVTTWAMFTPGNSEVWKKGITFLNEATLSYSRWVGDYPYKHITGVDGTISAGGGMEYPMITVIGQTAGEYGLDIVLSHEAGHNWFYGILASNERDHPWMDEGLNSFVEMKHIGAKYSKLGVFESMSDRMLGDAEEIEQGYRYQSELSYLYQARRGKDQPLHLHSTDFTPTNYGAMVYTKTALVFDMLLAYLGEERFLKCMHAYFDKWKFHHPGPKDIRAVFEQESGEDLSWMFDGFIATDKKYDPKAIALDGDLFSYHVRGGILAPFPISAWNGENFLGSVWIKPEKARGDFTLPWKNADRVRIDQQQRTLDIDRKNNEVRTSGLFKRGAGLKFKYLAGFDRSHKQQLYWNILPNYNTADGLSFGPLLMNTVFPSNRTEFAIAPMISTQTGNLLGGFRIDQHFDRSTTWTRGLHLNLSGRKSGVISWDELTLDYNKLSFEIRQDLKPNTVKKSVRAALRYRAIWIEERTFVKSDHFNLGLNTDNLYHSFTASALRSKGINPFSVALNVLSEPETFARMDLTAKWGIVLNNKADRLTFRVFGGQFLFTETGMDARAAYNSAGRTGLDDLLYSGVFLGRDQSRGIANRQFVNDQGGLKTPTTWGGSDDYMIGYGVDIDFPIGLPLVAYFNGVVVPTRPAGASEFEPTSAFDAGLGIRLFRDVVEIWVPIAVSQNIADIYEFQNVTFSDRIRFTLNLDKVNPTTLLRKIDP